MDLKTSDMVVPIDWEQTPFQSKSNDRTDALVVQAKDVKMSDVVVLIDRDQNITHLQTHPKCRSRTSFAQEVKLKVSDVVVLIDREQGGESRLASDNLRLHAAFTLSYILEVRCG